MAAMSGQHMPKPRKPSLEIKSFPGLKLYKRQTLKAHDDNRRAQAALKQR